MPTPIDLKGSIKIAQKALRDNKIIEAREICKSILLHFPHNKKAKDLLSKLDGDTFIEKFDPPKEQQQQLIDLYDQGQLEKALDLACVLEISFPNSALLKNTCGVLNGSLNRPEIAVSNLRQALKLKPNYVDAHFNLGKILQETNQPNAAIECYQKALEFDSRHVDAHYNLGTTYRAVGQIDSALSSYKKALRVNSKYANAHKEIGATFHVIGDLDSAIKSYKDFLRVKPNDSDVFNQMGNAFGEKGEHAESISCYAEALKIKPESVESLINMGIALKNKGEFSAAIESYEQSLKYSPENPEAHIGLGLALKAVEKYQEASLALQKAADLSTDMPQANYFLAAISYLKGDFYTAIKQLDETYLIDHENIPTEIARQVVKDKITDQKDNLDVDTARTPERSYTLNHEPLIANREVEEELINSLYEMKTRGLNDTGDARYGNGKCSMGLNLFDSSIPVIKKVSQELIEIIEKMLQKKFYSGESFFNVLSRGGGTHPHDHIGPYDREFDLSNHKYSLVYYLSVGDQDVDEPGILKLYNPDYSILPTTGMVLIIPAKRRHSSIYEGDPDRVMIGLNFYVR